MLFVNNVNEMTLPEMIGVYVRDFLRSPYYTMMIEGDAYYSGENTEISKREMLRYDAAGKALPDETRPNHKLKHGFMNILVDDKIDYLLTKPYTMTCEDDAYLKSVQELLGENFQNRLVRVGTDASCKGISWIHPYISPEGEFKMRLVPGEQGIPIWVDDEHTELEAYIWLYQVEVFEGKERKQVTKAEYWTKDRVAFYVHDGALGSGNGFILDSERYFDTDLQEDEFVEQFKVGETPDGWGKVPFIAFKNNDKEFSDLKRIKSLIDEYDFGRSDVGNVLEDMKSTIFGLKGYGGESLGEFMHDLSVYRAIKLDDDGGIDTYNPQMDINAASEHYRTLKQDIYNFGGGVNKDSDKLGNSPSGIALKFIYSGLDLKCNKMEACFKEGFKELLYFVNRYLGLTGSAAEGKAIDIVFNRDIAINESQAITDCQQSAGIVSQRTIVANHPWTVDVDEELKQLNKEKEEAIDDYAGAFGGGEAEKDGDVDDEDE